MKARPLQGEVRTFNPFLPSPFKEGVLTAGAIQEGGALVGIVKFWHNEKVIWAQKCRVSRSRFDDALVDAHDKIRELKAKA